MANHEINKEILEKIDESDVSDNVKEFIRKALEWEYEKMDEQKPRSTKKYDNLVKRYRD